MTDEQEIDEIDIEDVSTEIEDAPIKVSRFVGYKALGLATIIAALLGAGGGGMLSKFTAPSAPNLSPLTTQIEDARSENKTLKAQIQRLEQEMKKQKSAPKTSAPKIDLSPIEARLNTLETAEPQTAASIDPELLTRLEALQSEGSDALDLSDILARLEKLETQKVVNKTIQEADRKALLMELKTELIADEALAETDAAPRRVLSAATGLPMPMLPADFPAFPKAAILDAVSDADQSGWFKRTLNKRITVQSEDNPRYLVELIETDLDAGNIADALTKFDKLPENAKTAASEWRNAFKDTK